MRISVVMPILILSDKHMSMTMKCMSLAKAKTKLTYELVVVETCSQYFIDYADIYIHEKDKNSSAEKSHNRGFKVASGDFITLLTNDVYVEDGWLECMLDCFKISDCGASTLASSQFNHAKEDKIEEGNWFSTCMFKKEVFDKIGYYDDRFRDSWCDTDLLVRMYKQGYKMYRNFNCVVEHLIGQTNYDKPGFKDNYEMGRTLFNEKHAGCTLPIFEAVR